MRSIQGHLAKEAMKRVMASSFLAYRVQHNLTQEAMARNLSMSLRSYIDLEHGESLPSAASLALFLTMLEPSEQEKVLEQLRNALEGIRHTSKNS